MLILEIILSIHCLLLLSSWIIDKAWLTHQPSLKLKLARILLISCVISPFFLCAIFFSQLSSWLSSTLKFEQFKRTVSESNSL